MAFEEGDVGGFDLTTFIIGIIILGVIAQVGYTHLRVWIHPAPEQQQTATTTAQ